ncbi:glycosyltransferase family 2 protein [Acetobacter fabarum]|uniref:glycosyltransferase family 2 protein n=1 Tax=Acetobacter fabarum TaxID=483199 RepID=UPI00312B74A3
MFRCAVLVPSYNSGPLLRSTVSAVLAVWPDVVVVIDGSTDGSERTLDDMLPAHAGLKVLHLAQNGGKGQAVLQGALWAMQAGYTHVLTMDADGQHPAQDVPDFISLSRSAPQALVLGVPVFGPEAPALRVWGRKLSNILIGMETGGAVKDCLFGFRVYPLRPLLAVLQASRFMQGFDFDPEVVARMVWQGVRVLNKPAVVQYFNAAEGGISHFCYVRDNIRLIFMHLRLLFAWSRRVCCGKPPLSS